MAGRERGSIRIGAVSYLNSKPLIEGLERFASEAQLDLDFPSRLAGRLADGELDVALIPVVECLRSPDYMIVSDACVAACGPVLSVKMYSRVPVPEIKTLALDEGSRTSAALVRVMLSERFGVTPQLERLPLGEPLDGSRADAVLVIGDRAIHPPVDHDFVVEWDLGEQWYDWTGLPFVFAVWAARRDADLGTLESKLSQARDYGQTRLVEIARREAGPLGISEKTAFDYLQQNLYFKIGSAERSGLRLFQSLTVKMGLTPQGVDIVFRHHTPAR